GRHRADSDKPDFRPIRRTSSRTKGLKENDGPYHPSKGGSPSSKRGRSNGRGRGVGKGKMTPGDKGMKDMQAMYGGGFMGYGFDSNMVVAGVPLNNTGGGEQLGLPTPIQGIPVHTPGNPTTSYAAYGVDPTAYYYHHTGAQGYPWGAPGAAPPGADAAAAAAAWGQHEAYHAAAIAGEGGEKEGGKEAAPAGAQAAGGEGMPLHAVEGEMKPEEHAAAQQQGPPEAKLESESERPQEGAAPLTTEEGQPNGEEA
ncbi:unnamed protein product, partial [Vitrella brassicaformis CCMP3155]